MLFAVNDLCAMLETILCLGKEPDLICALAEFYDLMLFISKWG